MKGENPAVSLAGVTARGERIGLSGAGDVEGESCVEDEDSIDALVLVRACTNAGSTLYMLNLISILRTFLLDECASVFMEDGRFFCPASDRVLR